MILGRFLGKKVVNEVEPSNISCVPELSFSNFLTHARYYSLNRRRIKAEL